MYTKNETIVFVSKAIVSFFNAEQCTNVPPCSNTEKSSRMVFFVYRVKNRGKDKKEEDNANVDVDLGCYERLLKIK